MSPIIVDMCVAGEVLPAPARVSVPVLLLHPDCPQPAPDGQGEEAGGRQDNKGGNSWTFL